MRQDSLDCFAKRNVMMRCKNEMTAEMIQVKRGDCHGIYDFQRSCREKEHICTPGVADVSERPADRNFKEERPRPSGNEKLPQES